MIKTFSIKDILSWFLMILFIIIGVMNIIKVHPVPGIFYILISLFFYPPLDRITKLRFSFIIPYIIKIIIAFVILWVTLAVGDLAELYGM